jgi:hypothetical protein
MVARRLDRRIEPVLEADEPVQADRHGVRRPLWVGIVPRQLQSRQHQQTMTAPGTFGLVADLGQVLGVDGGCDHSSVSHDVVRDAQHVEPGTAVEIDDVRQLEITVAPARVRVQLAQETAPDHPRAVRAAHARMIAEAPRRWGGEGVSNRKRPGNRQLPLHLPSQLGMFPGASNKHGGLG